MSANLDYLLFYPAGVAATALALIAVAKADEKRPTGLWAASLACAALFLARTFLYAPKFPWWGNDFRIFWDAGRCFWEGRDPYTTIKGLRAPNDRVNVFLYPPQAITLFALFSIGPKIPSAYIWAVFNSSLFLCIGWLCRRVLIEQDRGNYEVIGPGLAALLSAAVLLSRSTSLGFDDGQVSMLATSGLLAALAAQGCRPPRAVAAAVALALASIKIATAMPFYLLFCRKSDLRMWLWFGSISAGLILVSGIPTRLPERISTMFESIAKLREPTYMNDYSDLGRGSNSILSLEVPLSRMGVADRRAVEAIAKAILAAMGAVVIYVVLGRSDVPRGAACSLVCLYSMLFLYHRIYDLHILILPIIYSASRFRYGPRRPRLCYLWIMIAAFLAMNAPIILIRRIDLLPSRWAVFKAFAVPMPIYLIVSALIAQLIAAWIDRDELPVKERVDVLTGDAAAGRMVR